MTYISVSSNFAAYIGEVVVTDTSSVPQMKLEKMNIGNLTYSTHSGVNSTFNYDVTISDNSTVISGVVTNSSSATSPIAVLEFSGVVPVLSRLYFKVSTSDNVKVDIYGMTVSGTHNQSTFVDSRLLSRIGSNLFFNIQLFSTTPVVSIRYAEFSVDVLGYTSTNTSIFEIENSLNPLLATFEMNQNGYDFQINAGMLSGSQLVIFRLPYFVGESSSVVGGTLQGSLSGVKTMMILTNNSLLSSNKVSLSIENPVTFEYGFLISISSFFILLAFPLSRQIRSK